MLLDLQKQNERHQSLNSIAAPLILAVFSNANEADRSAWNGNWIIHQSIRESANRCEGKKSIAINQSLVPYLLKQWQCKLLVLANTANWKEIGLKVAWTRSLGMWQPGLGRSITQTKGSPFDHPRIYPTSRKDAQKRRQSAKVTKYECGVPMFFGSGNRETRKRESGGMAGGRCLRKICPRMGEHEQRSWSSSEAEATRGKRG